MAWRGCGVGRLGPSTLAGAHDRDGNPASGGDVDAGTPETHGPRAACRSSPVRAEPWSVDHPVADLPGLHVEGQAAALGTELLLRAGRPRDERTPAAGLATERRRYLGKRARLSARLWAAHERGDSGRWLLEALDAIGHELAERVGMAWCGVGRLASRGCRRDGAAAKLTPPVPQGVGRGGSEGGRAGVGGGRRPLP